jgi:glycosyltransferase involved in cell wall biosynthesis
MNILELCLSPDFGGLEIHFRDFSRWLSRKEKTQLFLAVQENTRISEALADLELPQITFSSRAGYFPFLKAKKLSGFIDTRQIDVVHVHWKYDLPLVALAKRICKHRFQFVHTRQMNLPGRKFDFYHRLIYGDMDCFITITKYIQKQAEENLPISRKKIMQIYYGIEVPPTVTPDRTAQLRKQMGMTGDFMVGLLGRLSEFKGQHLLLEALEKLQREDITVHGWIVGEPFEKEYVNRLKKGVKDKQLSHQIHFMDFYDNPLQLMTCFDAVVLTTKNETFGLVLIEAMHAGVAVIGSNAGGVPEIIDHGKTGLLFETWNSDELAQAIKKLYFDEPFRKNLASAGQQKAKEKFDLETQYGKVYNIFKKLLQSSHH